jgi:hypothetical protein
MENVQKLQGRQAVYISTTARICFSIRTLRIERERPRKTHRIPLNVLGVGGQLKGKYGDLEFSDLGYFSLYHP